MDRGKKLHHRLKVLQEAVTKMELDRHRFGGTTLVKNKGGKAENGEKLQTGMQASHHWGWRWGCGGRRATGSKSLEDHEGFGQPTGQLLSQSRPSQEPCASQEWAWCTRTALRPGWEQPWEASSRCESSGQRRQLAWSVEYAPARLRGHRLGHHSLCTRMGSGPP